MAEKEGVLEPREVQDAAEAVVAAGKAGMLGGKTWQKKWAKKHLLSKRYAHQHNRDPEWFQHEKHVLICSWAGRPIFTRYGDDTKLAAYLAVVSAIVSNFQKSNDTVRSIIAGDHKFVFVLRGPIYMIAISRSSESVLQLRAQLNYTHDQIISVLTGSVHGILEKRPTYDMRNLMGGTESLLADLISEADRNPCFMLDSLHCLRLRRSTRSKIGSVLKKGRSKDVMWAVLFTGTRLIHMVQAKDRSMYPADLLILMNFVSNSQSLSSSESWTPICLPKFTDKGFLYAYVCYIDEDVCLVLITADGQGFHGLRECKQKIIEGFTKKNIMEGIREGMANADLEVEEVETGVPELRHFLYKSEPLSQIVVASPSHPFATKKAQKALLRRYQHMHSRIHDTPGIKPHSIYYEVSNTATNLAWTRPGEFEFYATFTPLVTKEAAMNACNKALRWIKKEESTLFII